MLRSKLVIAVLGLGAVVVLGGLFMSGPTTPAHAAKPDRQAEKASGPLDGLAFESGLELVGGSENVEDLLVFENGQFVSTECERRCNYPASPYFARREGARIAFISETRCPDMDAKIVWRGSVEDGVIQGESTWTVNRWYWTVEKKFRFTGRVSPRSG